MGFIVKFVLDYPITGLISATRIETVHLNPEDFLPGCDEVDEFDIAKIIRNLMTDKDPFVLSGSVYRPERILSAVVCKAEEEL
jgi:hypothetical protein